MSDSQYVYSGAIDWEKVPLWVEENIAQSQQATMLSVARVSRVEAVVLIKNLYGFNLVTNSNIADYLLRRGKYRPGPKTGTVKIVGDVDRAIQLLSEAGIRFTYQED